MRKRFTPGPWKIYRTQSGSLLGIGDAKAGGVTDYQGGFWRSGREKLSNIYLVAAAPQLYAALQSYVDFLEPKLMAAVEAGYPNEEHVARLEQAKEVLAVARGEREADGETGQSNA